MTSRMAYFDVDRCASLIYFRCFRTLNLYSMSGIMVCNKNVFNLCCTLDLPSCEF
jgi:hypothetical protein